MPELPEIETVKLQLGKALVGKKISGVEVRMRRTLQGDEKKLVGRKVTAVRRMAKVLLIDLDSSTGDGVEKQGMTMAFHFKMTGQLILDRDGDEKTYDDRIVGGHPTEDFVGKLPSIHTRVIFDLEGNDGGYKLYFNDQRLFGWVKIGTTKEISEMKFLQELGPEPFESTSGELERRSCKSRRAIKLVIMDQQVISGVGNIYANDALWEARINPNRPANTLKPKEYDDLFAGIIKVLREGIEYGGATAADAKYINLHGLGGHYQDHFRTYDREGKECLRNDGGKIERVVMGGRGTYYCPICQTR